MDNDNTYLLIEQFYLTQRLNAHSHYHSGSESAPRSNGNEGILIIPQTPGLEPHHQIQLSIIPKTLIGGVSYPSLCRGAVGIFYSLNQQNGLNILCCNANIIKFHVLFASFVFSFY